MYTFLVVSLILLFGGSLQPEASAEIQAITKLEKEQSMVVLDSGIPDSKALVFRFHKQTFSGFSLALGNDIWMQAKQLVDFWIRRLR